MCDAALKAFTVTMSPFNNAVRYLTEMRNVPYSMYAYTPRNHSRTSGHSKKDKKAASPPHWDCTVVLARWRQCALRCNTYFIRSIKVHNPNGISIGSAVFAGLSQTDRQTDHATWTTYVVHQCGLKINEKKLKIKTD